MTGSASIRLHYGAAWRSRVGVSPAGSLTIAAVVAVVVLVTLPRLRGFAQHENEVDARSTVELLAEELQDRRPAAGPGQGLPRVEELSTEPEVRQALSDGEFRASGRLLVRHGYLFTVVALPPPPPADPAAPPELPGVLAAEPSTTGPPPGEPVLALCAWPWKSGAAFLATADGRVFRHPNTPLRWSGPEARLRSGPGTWTGWHELSR